jgi:hypothetical protein
LTDIDPIAIGVKLGISALTRSAPKGLGWIVTYAGGANILLLGPKAAGKTSFADYLEFGVLEDENFHISTVDDRRSGLHKIQVGKDKSLDLKVRSTTDIPGQLNGDGHANTLRDHRPHAAITFLDGTKSQTEIVAWVAEFCSRLEAILMDDARLKKKLRTLIFVLNKRDKLTDKQYASRKTAIVKAVRENLAGALGNEKASKIQVLPCVSVSTEKYGISLIDKLVEKLAKELKKN